MKEKIKKFLNVINNKKETVYLVFLSLYVFFADLTGSTIIHQLEFIKIICFVIEWVVFAIFCLLILLEIFKFKTKELSWLFLISLLLSIVIAYIIGNNIVLFFIVFAFALKNTSFEKIVKAWLIPTVILFVLSIALSVLDKIPNWTYERSENQLRYSLGFGYATVPSTVFAFITLTYVYLRKSKISYFELSMLTVIAFLLYALTDTRTGLLLTLAIIVAVGIFKLVGNKMNIANFLHKRLVAIILSLIPLACLLVSLLLTYLYAEGYSFAISLDKMLSGRLQLQAEAFSKYSQTLFGQHIPWNGWGGYGYTVPTEGFVYNFIDNSWIRMVFDYGIVSTIFYVIIFSLSFYFIARQKESWLLFVSLIFILDTLIEPFLFSNRTFCSILMIIIVFNKDIKIFFKRNKNKKIEKIEDEKELKNTMLNEQ